jgi:hypothetical protein
MHVRLRTFAAVMLSCGLAALGFAISPGTATAAPGSVIFSGAPGTSAPPSVLGPYQMTAFPADTQPTGASVSGASGPTGTVGFSPSLEHCRIGGCWETWSNGYRGDVYATGKQTITLALPASTRAFYLYAEPEEFATLSITATSSDGTTSGSVPVAGKAGAKYFGFYATGSDTISSITVTTTDPDGFAVGEFGISDGLIHYVVNAEAWIPFSQVVDPLIPTAEPYLVTSSPAYQSQDPNCYTPPASKQLTTFVSSTYGGDSHIAFGTGTYRLRTEVSFDYDLTTGEITNFTQDSVLASGIIYRTKVYTSNGTVLDTCTQTLTAANIQVARLTSDTSFALGYSGKNPVPDLAPPHALINGSVASDGTLTLSYVTTQFPSQGIQVSVAGSPVNTDTENDVSCLGQGAVLGRSGVIRVGFGLESTEMGSVTVSPDITSTESNPSLMC